MDGENKIIEFIKEMYDNFFVPDIVVLFDGKKKEYEVENSYSPFGVSNFSELEDSKNDKGSIY